MAIITVYPWTYYNSQQGIREKGKGMCTKETIAQMSQIKDPEIIFSESKKIDDADLNYTDSGRYYDPAMLYDK